MYKNTVSQKKAGQMMFHDNFGKREPVHKFLFTVRFLWKWATYDNVDSHVTWKCVATRSYECWRFKNASNLDSIRNNLLWCDILLPGMLKKYLFHFCHSRYSSEYYPDIPCPTDCCESSGEFSTLHLWHIKLEIVSLIFTS